MRISNALTTVSSVDARCHARPIQSHDANRTERLAVETVIYRKSSRSDEVDAKHSWKFVERGGQFDGHQGVPPY